jgi:hypothetical protein
MPFTQRRPIGPPEASRRIEGRTAFGSLEGYVTIIMNQSTKLLAREGRE